MSIILDDKQRMPFVCDLCYSVLNSINNIIFGTSMDDLVGMDFFNFVLVYQRYFGFEIEKIPNPTTKISPQLKYHITLNNKSICKIPLDEIIQYIRPKLTQSITISENNMGISSELNRTEYHMVI